MSAHSDSSTPTLAFTSNWQQYVIGTLAPGAQARIAYDSNRLPEERSSYNGSPTWSIIAFYRFAPDAAVQQVTLNFNSVGMVPGPAQTVTTGSSFMYADIDVPAEAQSLEMWFLNSGRSGRQFWDSDYGQNYPFRFTAQDLGPVLANIVTSYPTPYSRFDVQLNQVDLAATDVAVNYRVTNIDSSNVFYYGSTFFLTRLTIEAGRAVWSGSNTVPYRANVIFTLTYTVGNQTYVALNGGAGFTAIGEASAVGTDASQPVTLPPQAPPPMLQV
jgi:hypothetical protein